MLPSAGSCGSLNSRRDTAAALLVNLLEPASVSNTFTGQRLYCPMGSHWIFSGSGSYYAECWKLVIRRPDMCMEGPAQASYQADSKMQLFASLLLNFGNLYVRRPHSSRTRIYPQSIRRRNPVQSWQSQSPMEECSNGTQTTLVSGRFIAVIQRRKYWILIPSVVLIAAGWR